MTDANGARWRVFDLWFGPPHHPPYKRNLREPPDAAASKQCFVGEGRSTDGRQVTRTYGWAQGEPRTDLAEPTLLRQLSAAEWWDRRPVSEPIPGYTPTHARGDAN